MTNKSLVIIIVVLAVIVLGIYFIISSIIPNNNQGTGNVQPSPQTTRTGENSFNIQGMKVEILKDGTGDGAKNGDKISAHYVLNLPDGKEVDSSVKRNAPFAFQLGQGAVIKGWDLGLLGMKVGEVRKLTIPPELGYGSKGVPPVIPPNSTLIYIVQRVK